MEDWACLQERVLSVLIVNEVELQEESPKMEWVDDKELQLVEEGPPAWGSGVV